MGPSYRCEDRGTDERKQKLRQSAVVTWGTRARAPSQVGPELDRAFGLHRATSLLERVLDTMHGRVALPPLQAPACCPSLLSTLNCSNPH